MKIRIKKYLHSEKEKDLKFLAVRKHCTLAQFPNSKMNREDYAEDMKLN